MANVRSMWSGSMQVGLIVVPLKLYKARQEQDVELKLLHAEDGGRISRPNFCGECDRTVGPGDLDKGYETADGSIVQLPKEELDALRVPSRKTVEVSQFLGDGEVSELQFDEHYFIKPDPAAIKPFALIRGQMVEQGKVALGKVTFRSRERVCLIRPLNGGRTALTTLYWPDEMRDDQSFYSDEELQASKQEIQMAGRLVKQMTRKFDAAKQTDGYRQALNELIQTKLAGDDLKPTREQKQVATASKDLMNQLKASVDAAKG